MVSASPMTFSNYLNLRTRFGQILPAEAMLRLEKDKGSNSANWAGRPHSLAVSLARQSLERFPPAKGAAGPGFVKVAGTDTCVKVGGAVGVSGAAGSR